VASGRAAAATAGECSVAISIVQLGAVIRGKRSSGSGRS
jgi:hypothetical protein